MRSILLLFATIGAVVAQLGLGLMEGQCMMNYATVNKLVCTANDISIAQVTNIVITDPCLFSGDIIVFSAQYAITSTAARDTLDLGIFISRDGDLNGDGAATGECWGFTPPPVNWIGATPVPSPTDFRFTNLDGDNCGDITSKSSRTTNMTLKLICTDKNRDGKMDLPWCTGWKVPGGDGPCSNATNALPSSGSKCNCNNTFGVSVTVPGAVQLRLVTVNINGQSIVSSTSFAFTSNLTPNGTAFLMSTSTAPYFFFPSQVAGRTYSVAYTVPPGWSGYNTTCTDITPGFPSTVVSSAINPSFALPIGAVVSCVFVVKQVSIPAITVTYAPSGSVAESGGSITYTVTITNTALVTTTLTTLQDTRYGDLTQMPGSTCTLRSITPGQTITCTFSATISGTSTPLNSPIPPVVASTLTVSVQDPTGSTSRTVSATVTYTDILPAISVSKTANPTSVSEVGGSVTFTVRVTNTNAEPLILTTLSDNVFGNLFALPAGTSTCSSLSNIAIGANAEVSCTFTVTVTPPNVQTLAAHTNRVTATAGDNEGHTDTRYDDETVTFIAISPEIDVTKTASVTHVSELGGDVTFTVTIVNTKAEPVTLQTLTDTVFGNLLTRPGDNTCRDLAGGTIAGNGQIQCQFTAFVEPSNVATLADQVSRVDATVIDRQSNTATDFASSTTTFDPIAPEIDVTKTVDPSHVSEVGGTVIYTVTVENKKAEPVTLDSLVDTIFGNLLTRAGDDNTCRSLAGTTIAGNGNIQCHFSAFITSPNVATLADHVSRVDATVHDRQSNAATDYASATVTFDHINPDIGVAKTADPTHVSELGGVVTFKVQIDNKQPEAVTLYSLTDSIFGNLLTRPGDDNTCRALASTTITGNGNIQCQFTATVTPPNVATLANHVNQIDVEVRDLQSNPATGSATATVTFDPIAPEIDVTKTPNPTHVIELGDDVTFAVKVENKKAESVTLKVLRDNLYGDLLTRPGDDNTCRNLADTTIAGNSFVQCQFTIFVTSPNVATLTNHVNQIDAEARDRQSNPATDSTTATVTFDPISPEIHVIAVANPTHVSELGGDVIYTITVQNLKAEPVTLDSLVDNTFGDLLTRPGDGNTCRSLAGTTIAGNGQVQCQFTATVTSPNVATLAPLASGVTARVHDRQSNPASDYAGATVIFDPIAPEIDVTKSANPAHISELGANVVFSVGVENKKAEPVTLDSLVDTIFGNLLTRAGEDNTCRSLAGTTIAGNGNIQCQFTAFVTSPNVATLADHVSRVDATVHDRQSNAATDYASATVTFENIPPSVTVVKTASPESVLETGGIVTFTITVTNNNLEPLTLDSLVDSIYGNIIALGNCAIQIPTALAGSQSYSCSFTKTISGVYPETHTNRATVTVHDRQGTSNQGSDDASVTLIDVAAELSVAKDVFVGATNPEEGGLVTYKVTLTSSGAGPDNLHITDWTDAGCGLSSQSPYIASTITNCANACDGTAQAALSQTCTPTCYIQSDLRCAGITDPRGSFPVNKGTPVICYYDALVCGNTGLFKNTFHASAIDDNTNPVGPEWDDADAVITDVDPSVTWSNTWRWGACQTTGQTVNLKVIITSTVTATFPTTDAIKVDQWTIAYNSGVTSDTKTCTQTYLLHGQNICEFEFPVTPTPEVFTIVLDLSEPSDSYDFFPNANPPHQLIYHLQVTGPSVQ